MKTNTRKTLALNVAAITLMGIALASRAAIIVHWGEATDIVSTTTNMVAGQNDSSLNLTTPSNPTVGASYYNSNADRSPLFYANAATDGNIDRYSIRDGGTDADTILVRNSGNDTDADVLMVWTQTGNGGNFGYLNGADDAPKVDSLALTQLTLEADLQSSGDKRFSWVIQLNNSSWYISEDVGNLANRDFVPFTSTPGTLTWSNYSPETNIGTIGAAASLASFDKVTAVGFFSHWNNASSSARSLQVREFIAEADITFIPEPASISLLALASVGLLRRRRASR